MKIENPERTSENSAYLFFAAEIIKVFSIIQFII